MYEDSNEVSSKTERFKIGKILFVKIETMKTILSAPFTTIKSFSKTQFRSVTLIFHSGTHISKEIKKSTLRVI